MTRPAPIVPLGPERIEYQTPFTLVTQTDVRFPDGSTGTYARVNKGSGASAIARRIEDGVPRYALIEQYRFPIDRYTLELPGGGISDDSAEEALRELMEETGIRAIPGSGVYLGPMYPSGGVLASVGNAWLFDVEEDSDDAYVEADTGARHRWVTDAELDELIVTNQLTCALALSAFMKLRVSPHYIAPPAGPRERQ